MTPPGDNGSTKSLNTETGDSEYVFTYCSLLLAMRYNIIRSVSDKHLHLIFEDVHPQANGTDPFERVPQQLRALGPWQGLSTGTIQNLKPHYRLILAEQGFTLIYSHMSSFSPERGGSNSCID